MACEKWTLRGKKGDRENGEMIILTGMELMKMEEVGMSPRIWLEHQVRAAICS